MPDTAQKVVRSLADEQAVARFAARLRAWLLDDLSQETDAGQSVRFTESRARALLRATEAADEPALNDYANLMATPAGARSALYDLLQNCELAENSDVQALAAVSNTSNADEADEDSEAPRVPWLSLIMAAHAYQRGYPLQQLDPGSPPERYSPAGQIVWRTAQFLRKNVQRSATEREKLAATLAPHPSDRSAALDEQHNERPIAPLPPHFRPPVPVRYPEISRDTVRIESNDEASPPVTRSDPLVITEEDLGDEPQDAPADEEPEEQQRQPVRMPPIRIERSQVEPSNPPSPLPASGVIMPNSTTESRPGLTVAIRQMFRSEEMATTRLRVIVRDEPDGNGLYGLQVKVTCRGIRSFVAGTTDRDGHFVAELPVRLEEGMTYHVDVTWPRELGADTERKTITLHADRTEFKLPFFHRQGPTTDQT